MGGEDPRFIARRLVIFASEDIGLADSRALLMADATFRACETIGLPECELNLAHCVLFLTTCPKSNSATLALAEAKKLFGKTRYNQSPVQFRIAMEETKNIEIKRKKGISTVTIFLKIFPVSPIWKKILKSTSPRALVLKKRSKID